MNWVSIAFDFGTEWKNCSFTIKFSRIQSKVAYNVYWLMFMEDIQFDVEYKNH